MDDIKIREAHLSDYSKIQELVTSCKLSFDSESFWEKCGANWGIVAEHQDQVIGFLGTLPFTMNSNSSNYKGFCTRALAVNPKYAPASFKIMEYFLKTRKSDFVFATSCNEKSSALFKFLKMKPIDSDRHRTTQVFVLNGSFFKLTIPMSWLVLQFFQEQPKKIYTLVSLDPNDSRIDQFWEEREVKTISSPRNRLGIKEKLTFLENLNIWAHIEDEKILGLAIVSLSNINRYTLLDLYHCGDPKGFFKSVLAKAKENNANALEALESDLPESIKQSHRLARKQDFCSFYFYPKEENLSKSYQDNSITLGNYDGDRCVEVC